MSIATSTDKQGQLKALLERAEMYSSRLEWLHARQAGVGASESATLFDVGYEDTTVVSLYADKVCDVRDTRDAASEERLSVGKDLEPGLRNVFSRNTGCEVIDVGDFTIFRHPTVNHLTATLDGLLWDSELNEWCVAELKNIGHFNKWAWEDEATPKMYLVQVQHQLACTGLQRGYLLALLGGNVPVVRVIERNDSFIEELLLPTVTNFWAHVEQRIIPAVDAKEGTKRALERIFSGSSDTEVMLPAECEQWDTELIAIKEQIKGLEEQKGLIENKLRLLIGECTVGLLPHGGKYTWRKSDCVVKSHVRHSRPLRRGK